MANQRSWRAVPAPLCCLLLASLAAQIAWSPRTAHLPDNAGIAAPPGVAWLKLASQGEPVAAAQLAALRLQAADHPSGGSIPFRRLDYARVEAWLARSLELDPLGQYPLLMASQLYAQVPDAARQRRMLAFTYRQFLADPNRRWPWLAHAAIVARHRLHDLPLALAYADAIAYYANGLTVPHWAKQLRIFILEEMGEMERARTLLGGLLASGTITDAHEMRFLAQRLQTLGKQRGL